MGVSSNGRVFLQTSAKPMLQLLSGCLPFFSCLELSPCALRFLHHQLDFANFASQPIIMQTCEEFRVKMESVVFSGMNENVGEGGGEKEERAEGWWWWWL